MNRFLAIVSQLLPQSVHTSAVLTSIRNAYRPEWTVAAGFRHLLEEWLAPFDVLTTDAADAALKQASTPALEQALFTGEAQEASLAAASARLESAGYAPQVAVLPGATNLFLADETGRERLYRGREGFVTHDTGRTFSEAQMRAAIAADPARLSPNVFLRPVVESLVFPSLAYVAGPGEISYFAQLGPLFAEYGITAPVVYPRASALLVEPAVARALGELGLEVEDLAAPRHEIVTRLARAALPRPVNRALEDLRRATVRGYQDLMDAEALRDPGLAGALGRLRNESLASIARSERKILRQIKRRDEARAVQVDRVRAHLRPDGVPQERVLNAAQFVAGHGPGLLLAVRDRIGTSLPPLVANASPRRAGG